MIKLTCACGKSLKAPYHLMGKVVLCSRCKSQMVVPHVEVPSTENAFPATADDQGLLVQCQCGQHFMAARNLRGQSLACPICSRMIAVPPVEGDSSPPHVASNRDRRSIEEEDDDFEYQVAEPTSAPTLEKIAMRSTLDALRGEPTPDEDADLFSTRPVPPPAPSVHGGNGPLRDFTPLPANPPLPPYPPAPPSSIVTGKTIPIMHERLIPGVPDRISGGILMLGFAAIVYWFLAGFETTPGARVRVPVIFIILYLLLGKEGISGLITLVALAIFISGIRELFLGKRKADGE